MHSIALKRYQRKKGNDIFRVLCDLFVCKGVIFLSLSIFFMYLYFDLLSKQEMEKPQTASRNNVEVFLEIDDNNETIISYKGKKMRIPEDVFEFVNIVRQVKGKVLINMIGKDYTSYQAFAYFRNTVKKNFSKDKIIWSDRPHTKINPDIIAKEASNERSKKAQIN
jgi:hypothetical protein